MIYNSRAVSQSQRGVEQERERRQKKDECNAWLLASALLLDYVHKAVTREP